MNRRRLNLGLVAAKASAKSFVNSCNVETRSGRAPCSLTRARMTSATNWKCARLMLGFVNIVSLRLDSLRCAVTPSHRHSAAPNRDSLVFVFVFVSVFFFFFVFTVVRFRQIVVVISFVRFPCLLQFFARIEQLHVVEPLIVFVSDSVDLLSVSRKLHTVEQFVEPKRFDVTQLRIRATVHTDVMQCFANGTRLFKLPRRCHCCLPRDSRA